MNRLWLAAAALTCVAACGGKKDGDGEKGGAGPAPPAAPAAPAARPSASVMVDFPGTREGALALLKSFLVPEADTVALSAALRPKAEDYAAVFVGDAAETARTTYAPAWDAGAMHVRPKEGQSALLVWSATGAQIAAGEGDAGEFPGGYRQIADKLKPDVTFYRFKFVRPGETTGLAFDGLVHVNGRWVMFPKPYRALQ